MNPIFSAQQLFEMEQARETLKMMIPEIVEGYKISAKLKRGKYNALVGEGFSSEEAIQIIVAGKESTDL